MTKKPAAPRRAPARPAAEGGTPKKPSAMIELKATAVEDKGAGTAKPSDDPKSPKAEEKGATEPAHASSSTGAGPQGAQPGEAPKPAAAATSPPSAKPTHGDPPSDNASTEKPSPKRARGIGGFFTHLAAGIAGGFLALLGADTIGPQLGLTADPWTKHASELQRRLGAVEQTAAERAVSAAESLQKLASAESRLAQLEDLNQSVTQLRDAQAQLGEAHAKLAGDTQALEQKLSKPDAVTE